MTTMPYDLSGSRILVTGAAGGIGAETALLCARLGADLVLTDAKDCAGVERAVRDLGRRADSRSADLCDPDAVRMLADWAGDVDCAVLAAGIYRVTDWDHDDWSAVLDATLDANLTAPAQLARALLPRMAARQQGRLVLLGSIVAVTGGSFPGVGPHYAMSKGGLHTLVRWLAARYTPQGVLINGVAPGITDTPMVGVHDLSAALARHPMGRAARPAEIAWPIAFLCSPGASFLSGAILDVNGGAMMRP